MEYYLFDGNIVYNIDVCKVKQNEVRIKCLSKPNNFQRPFCYAFTGQKLTCSRQWEAKGSHATFHVLGWLNSKQTES